jgi:hypothetical protein
MLNFCSESLVHTTPTLPQGVLTNLLTFLLTREFVRRFGARRKGRGCWLPSRRQAASRAVSRAAGSQSISPTVNWPALLTGSCAPSLDPARRLGNWQVGIDEDPSLPGVGIALQDGGGGRNSSGCLVSRRQPGPDLRQSSSPAHGGLRDSSSGHLAIARSRRSHRVMVA